jgi:septal ring factor EnvC (AmiA/AmiB activator)
MSETQPGIAQLNRTLAELLRNLQALERRAAGHDRDLVMLRDELVAVRARVGALEARVEGLDASFVRHRQQHESSVDALSRAVDAVGERLDRHEGDHWRERR